MRSTLGYTGEQPRMQMLQNREFVDAKVEIYLKQGSKVLAKLAEYPIQRQLLTRSSALRHLRHLRHHIIRGDDEPRTSTLERRLGPLDGAAIIVSNVIGGTILFAPPFMAGLVPNPWLYLGLWVAGGALAFAGAMAYAELAALRPKAGGEYVYLDAAYGRVAAFLTGWTSFVAGFSGAIAANAFFIPIYLARFIPGVDNQTPIFTIPLPYVPLTLLHAHAGRAGVGVAAGADSHPRRRSWTRDDERAGRAQGHGVPAVRARRLRLRHRRVLERHRLGRRRVGRPTGCSRSSP